ncbi:MAG: class I SAM-dependent methyltransferase [Actinomycetota bacterium]
MSAGAGLREDQRAAWAAGDFSRFATTILLVSESLCEAADLHAGQRVLDVACGSGNTALCAARRWCEVTGIDFEPGLLARARARADFEGLDVELLEADAHDLPFPEASFDAVLSTFGVMFAADQPKAASEMLRVCRPGGTIGMANFTSASLAMGFMRVSARYRPPPRRVGTPTTWAMVDGLRDLFGDAIASLEVNLRSVIFRYRSADHWLEFFRSSFGPIRMVHETLDPEQQEAYGRDLKALVQEANRSGDGTIVAPVEYAEVIIRTREDRTPGERGSAGP